MSTQTKVMQSWEMTTEQRDMWERFQAAYNSIDRCLRKQLGSVPAQSFLSVVKEYERTCRFGSDGDYLRMAADLRNVLIHQKTKPYLQLAIPTKPVVERLEAIGERIANPPKLLPRFQRRVEVLDPHVTLGHVLRLIAQRDYSQFPVYEGGRFRGLLTENGITRWLAHHVTKELSLVDLDEVPVKQVLPEEEKRPNWLFVARDRTVDEVKMHFREKELLEAVLITQTGNRTEQPLGIATRWDILHED